MDITFDRHSMIIDGRREVIRSGAMHYFRLPSQSLWEDRLFKLKAAGYNAVDLYFCWGYHSSAPGEYDFTGIRDVRRLLEITQALGLWVIARPGPYINAEYSGGGFPGWLLAKKHLPLRNRRDGAFEWSNEYMAHVREWWTQIVPILNEAPNILMMQIENEYATLEVEPDYMRALYDLTRALGVTVPLFHNDLYVAGLYEDIVDIYAFDNYSVTQFETNWREMPEVFQVLDNVENSLRPFCEHRPLMAAELQAGWFGTWKGYKYEKITELLGREHIGISTKSLLGQGLTIFNHYKAIGGTNWNYTGAIETYTSYDFGAPIAESGLNTERLFEAKAINSFLASFDLSVTDRRAAFPLSVSHPEFVYAVRTPPAEPESAWLFLRNLTYDAQTLTVGEDDRVTLKPFEVQILPYRIRLQSGYELVFCTAEALYQNACTLVLKADRPVTVRLQAPDGHGPLSCSAATHDLTVLAAEEADGVSFYCPELNEDEFRQLQVGDLHVLLLGQRLIDTFWVEEDGALRAGADLRLPDGAYALASGRSSLLDIPKTGGEVETRTILAPPPLEIPLLRQWEIFDNAPELNPAYELADSFLPVKDGVADFDANALYEGSAWYRLVLDGDKPESISVDARHIWAVFLNGRPIGHGHQLVVIYGMSHPEPKVLPVPADCWRPAGPNELLIFVNGLGHPKGFHDDAQTPQGLLGLQVNGGDRTAAVRMLPEMAHRRQGTEALESALAHFERSPLVRMRTAFTLPKDDAHYVSWGLKLQDLDYERVDLYLNGRLVGRYWRDCRRQELFYLPSGILKPAEAGENRLELVLMNFAPLIARERLAMRPQQVTLHPYGVFARALQQSKTLID